MRTQFSKIALTATLGLALAFTISCSSDDGDKGGDDGNKKKRNLAGCLRVINGNRTCTEYDDSLSTSDEQLNTLMKESCDKSEVSEYLPGGCPDDWKARCITAATATYIYDAKIAENMLNSSTSNCTKK